MTIDWKETLTHPASIVTGVLSVVGIAVKPAALTAIFAAIWAQAGTIFTAASVAAFSLVPNVPSLTPFQPIAVGAAIVASVVYLVKLGDKIMDEFERRL